MFTHMDTGVGLGELGTVFGRVYHFEDAGAVGNGIADDSLAIYRTVAKLKAGDGLCVTADKTFTHSDIIDLAVPGVTVFGGGTLAATVPNNSAIMVDADGITIDNIQTSVTPTARGSQLHNYGVVINKVAGATLGRIRVNGSQGAGIFNFGGTDFLIAACQVSNSLADAFHNTEGASNGLIIGCKATNPGDDGMAVVSYTADPAICSDIRCLGFVMYGQTGGRGMSVVGGQNIFYEEFLIYDSWAAAIYLAPESNTRGNSNTHAHNGKVVRANQGYSKGGSQHGALLINTASSADSDDISMTDIESWDAGDSIGTGVGQSLALRKGGTSGALTNVRMERIRIRGTHPLNVISNSSGITGAFQDIDLGRYATTSRQTPAQAGDGCTYMDTTLGVRGYCNGANWKNGAGTNI